ncbi:MAG: hypothetical protein R2711_13825 [Acidimicrobiales bacterium]
MTDAPPEVMGLNPFAPGFFDDPYAQYAEVRAGTPSTSRRWAPG